MKLKPSPTRVDSMFRAFSDPTRLRILNLLRTGETCVCDLQSVLDVPQPKVSRHLAYLRKTKLVEARKDGLWSYYRLAPAPGAFPAQLLACVGCCCNAGPEIDRDIMKLKRTNCARSNDCCG